VHTLAIGRSTPHAARVVDQGPRAEATRHHQQIEGRQLLVHAVGRHPEAALVLEFTRRADDPVRDLAGRPHRPHAAEGVVDADQVEERQAGEGEEGDAPDQRVDCHALLLYSTSGPARSGAASMLVEGLAVVRCAGTVPWTMSGGTQSNRLPRPRHLSGRFERGAARHDPGRSGLPGGGVSRIDRTTKEDECE
jgi:hypothetical protein